MCRCFSSGRAAEAVVGRGSRKPKSDWPGIRGPHSLIELEEGTPKSEMNLDHITIPERSPVRPVGGDLTDSLKDAPEAPLHSPSSNDRDADISTYMYIRHTNWRPQAIVSAAAGASLS